jgi:hypothetical protein
MLQYCCCCEGGDKRLAIQLSFSAGLGLEKPNSGLDPGETNSGSDLDSDETFQISRNLGLDIDEIVCLLDSQLCLQMQQTPCPAAQVPSASPPT